MVPSNFHNLPKCTIDFPLEFTSEEMIALPHPINTLLRSSYLIGGSFAPDESIHSLFDISEEIAGVEVCGFLFPLETPSGSWELKVSRRLVLPEGPAGFAELFRPAAIASHFGKGISIRNESGPWAKPMCDAWGTSSLVTFPLRRERDIVGALVFGKKEHNPFTHVQIKLLWALSMQAETHLHLFDSVSTPSYYSFLDPLTHLNNKQYFDDQLGKEVLRSRRSFALPRYGWDVTPPVLPGPGGRYAAPVPGKGALEAWQIG
jgi:hypothetical protein